MDILSPEFPITNQLQPYQWWVSGYVDMVHNPYYYVDQDSGTNDCYIAVDPTYPFPQGNFPMVYLYVTRNGASHLEVYPNDNFAFEYCHIDVLPPTEYLIQYTANPNVLEQISPMEIDELFDDASYIARRQDPQHPLGKLWFNLRDLYEQYYDRSVNMHLVGVLDDVYPNGALPQTIDGCKKDDRKTFLDAETALGQSNIPLFLFDTGKWCYTFSGEVCLSECFGIYGKADAIPGYVMSLSIRSPYPSETLLHELGHVVGLTHTFGEEYHRNVMLEDPPELRGWDIRAGFQENSYLYCIPYPRIQ